MLFAGLCPGTSLVLQGCGGTGGDDATFGGEDATGGPTGPTTASGVGTSDASAGTTAVSGTSTTEGASSETTESASTMASGDDDGRPSFDVGSEDLGGSNECDCGSNEFSYIWAANAPESTVSKINTVTMQEEGRYPTHPEGDGNPSRTSVSVDGRAVVVQNRDKPGLAKIWADTDLCDPNRNGQPGLQTSNGGDDVLAFEDDDCIEWWTPFPEMTQQRPVAWTQGTLDADCNYVDQKIWTVTGANGTPGHCGTDGVWVHRVNGDTGAIEDSVHVQEADFPCNDSRGSYGGAVDSEGNFWFSGWQNNKLARVDFESLDVEVVDVPGSNPYGITVDRLGRPWLTWPVRRYDPVMQEWDEIAAINAGTGIAEDGEGRMWVSDGDDLVWINRDTMAIGETFALPDQELPNAEMPRGIAVDLHGMVWVVRRLSNLAYRVDPTNGQLDAFDQLNGAYTYSDMTGGQLQGVTCNPEG